MHDPVSLGPPGRAALIEHEGLLDPNILWPAVDCLVRARGLPVARHGRPVGAHPVRVLPVPRREEVTLVLPEFGFLYKPKKAKPLINQHTTYTYNWIAYNRHKVQSFFHGGVLKSGTNQVIARDQICKYQLLGWWLRGMAWTWPGFLGNAWLVLHPWDGIWTQEGGQSQKKQTCPPF